MSDQQRIGSGWLINVALGVFGLVVLVLLYALVTRFVLTPDTAAVAASETPTTSTSDDIIQVEVRNGCGVSGLAAETTRFLRQRGFDVVEMGDLGAFTQEQSVVIDRVGNLEAAQRVAASLGLPPDRVKQDIQLDYYLDASVILGKDYKTLIPFQDP